VTTFAPTTRGFVSRLVQKLLNDESVTEVLYVALKEIRG
jgi:hypothetical protein